jgi:putative SOS response-associated peptidase YedK
MPLILNPDQEKTWLSLPAIQPDEIQKWSESEEPPLDIFSVSQRLNKSFENDSTLLQAEAVKVVQQLSIF